ncbi:MAG: 4Fe-4S dicluster domain-containing protein [Candidatus Lokiarchaeota archaeon]|nr:4Fe-4S dicluster domain-containing protein [Candidatus Lokiarchaeota archaeon]
MSNYYLITFADFSEILKTLIREKIVDKVISGEGKRNRFQISPLLESDPKKLEEFPLSSLFIYNFDRINSASKFLHKKAGGALTEKIAMIGHPADARALIELGKRLQVELNNVFVIVLENIGTIQANDVINLLKEEGIDPESVEDDFLTDEEYQIKLKDGTIKKYPLGKKIDITDNDKRADIKKLDQNFDLGITWITLEPFSHELILRIGSEKAKDLFSKLTIKKVEVNTKKLDVLLKKQSEIMEKARIQKEKDISEYLSRPDRINELAKCTMCGVCINACPVCFCTDCILQKQRKEKNIDNLTYQMTRVAHIGDSCVNCGKCDINCPTHLPLSLYFYSVTTKIKNEFKYETGMKKKEPIPRSWTALERGTT